MAVRKICKHKGCRASPRCDHPWWFDLTHEGRRWRMPVNDFAIPRGATGPVNVEADCGEGLGTEVPRRNRGRP